MTRMSDDHGNASTALCAGAALPPPPPPGNRGTGLSRCAPSGEPDAD